MTSVNIPKVKLNNGHGIPALGYGTWVGYDDKQNFIVSDIPKLVDTLSYAIDIGYRHIDTAHLYRVEPEIGEVINKKIEDGIAKREEFFVTTKVWQHFHRVSDVEVSVRGSLRRLNLEYVDLVLIHWPMSIDEEGVDQKIDYLETWRGLEVVLKKGLTKAIGVSNFNVEQLKRLLANSTTVPAVNQVEINLNLRQLELVEFCKANNIAVVAYSPFGTMVPSRAAPNSPEPKLDNPIMMKIAQKYGKTVSQIALRCLFQGGIITIPKTITRKRVIENASIFDFELDDEDMKTIGLFNNGYRTVKPVFFQDYENYPFDKVPGVKKEIPLVLRKWKNGANLDID